MSADTFVRLGPSSALSQQLGKEGGEGRGRGRGRRGDRERRGEEGGGLTHSDPHIFMSE